MSGDMEKTEIPKKPKKPKKSKSYTISFPYSTGIPDAMKKVNDDGIPTATFIKKALIEKLKRRGYLPKISKDEVRIYYKRK